ncbi:MAG: PDZ domain-containing protein [Methylacidiphilales bacterium]|nr:PDZ domain-containing protein [Candidatus Methylacidiphilales bacterium]
MKSFHAVCLLGLLPAFAHAQSTSTTDAPKAPALAEPILARDHSGLGRIGVRLAYDKATGYPIIAALTRGGPAEDFGFRVGDVIIKIDKNYTTAMTQDQISLALHGDPGSGVELTIQRDNYPHYIIRAVERRILRPGSEDMINPPMSETANLNNLPEPATP